MVDIPCKNKKVATKYFFDNLSPNHPAAKRLGRATTDDLETINNIVKNQLDVLIRIGNIGKFVAADIQERISTLASLDQKTAHV